MLDERLYEVELRNVEHFGYGVKGFVLSMIETAIELTGGRIDGADIRKIIDWGRQMLRSRVELLDGVQDALAALADRYQLILLTKGDLLHQESKLARSGRSSKGSRSCRRRTRRSTHGDAAVRGARRAYAQVHLARGIEAPAPLDGVQQQLAERIGERLPHVGREVGVEPRHHET